MSRIPPPLIELLELTDVALRRSERGAGHVREHCRHEASERVGCPACDARWEAALAVDALERGVVELYGAVDRVMMSTIKLSRAALRQPQCAECGDLAVDAVSLRDELAAALGVALGEVADLGALDEPGEGHAEGPGDALERER